ncbi:MULTISPECIES: sirohydrochlorin chelatase [unclassified Corynebacterium]|uniref:sirohydrochlorin chelatase n=1 Tax=Corynebacterium TaxID=1716 RepID=UPI00254B0049|nr:MULTISPECIES: CbiX/SirB N-terminal domain-containing protein [unclassified Corynebacterium]MDK8466386.1 CbiX/SirB N-terminal domain-containing protein [Corynebacterium sp. MSK130]MDK8686738.1 CbiX/SirB N-terminal domain-containing protein [Corynebacterium sp. MSK122]MDK8829843.1 CbiX/SirB N-terminal domain-containing protein [Corynebacterium sp. MSK072]
MTALITLSHGSRHPGAAAGVEQLTQAAAAAIPDRPAYRAAHLEFNTPDLTAAAVDLARCGEDTAVVIPLLFTQGYHQRVDVPRVIAAAEQASGLRLVQGECLGGGRAVPDVGRREAAEAELAAVLAARARSGDTHHVIYSVGSSAAAANDSVRRLAAQVSRITGVPATAAFATRGGSNDIHALARSTARMRVIPLFVTAGLLLKPLSSTPSNVTVDPVLGTDLAGIVAAHYHIAQEVGVPC